MAVPSCDETADAGLDPARFVSALAREDSNVPEESGDEALVRAYLRGEEQAFAQLVRRHLRKAMAVAMEYARSREDAEDIVQETFRRVHENLRRFDPDRSFEPWFYAVLRNTARNAAQHRRLREHDALDDATPSAGMGPYEAARRTELRAGIDAAMAKLPPMQSACFRLCAVEGLTGGEAAHALGLAESTVRVHVFKARQALQRHLDAWRDELEEV